MAPRSQPAQIQECPVCGTRQEAPLPQEIWCGTRHRGKRGGLEQVQMVVIWDKQTAGDTPPPSIKKGKA